MHRENKSVYQQDAVHSNGDVGRRIGASNYGYSQDSEKDEISHVPNGNGILSGNHSTSNGTTNNKKTVVIVGSGDLGMALTMCFVRSGYRVVVASRNPNKNRKNITDLGGEVDFFERAVQQSSIIIVAIPYETFDTLSSRELRGKIVVDVSNRRIFLNILTCIIKTEQVFILVYLSKTTIRKNASTSNDFKKKRISVAEITHVSLEKVKSQFNL